MKKTMAVVAPLALCAVLAGGLAWSGSTQADDAPSKPAFAVLTDEGLGTMLEQMGYSPKKLSKGYLITIKRDSWTIAIQLVLSPDKGKVGMNANLGKVEPETVTAEQWKALLIANGEIDPSTFYYDEKQGKLYLHRVLDNRAIDAALLRKQIEAFCDNMTSTSKLWSFTK